MPSALKWSWMKLCSHGMQAFASPRQNPYAAERASGALGGCPLPCTRSCWLPCMWGLQHVGRTKAWRDPQWLPAGQGGSASCKHIPDKMGARWEKWSSLGQCQNLLGRSVLILGLRAQVGRDLMDCLPCTSAVFLPSAVPPACNKEKLELTYERLRLTTVESVHHCWFLVPLRARMSWGVCFGSARTPPLVTYLETAPSLLKHHAVQEKWQKPRSRNLLFGIWYKAHTHAWQSLLVEVAYLASFSVIPLWPSRPALKVCSQVTSYKLGPPPAWPLGWLVCLSLVKVFVWCREGGGGGRWGRGRRGRGRRGGGASASCCGGPGMFTSKGQIHFDHSCNTVVIWAHCAAKWSEG